MRWSSALSGKVGLLTRTSLESAPALKCWELTVSLLSGTCRGAIERQPAVPRRIYLVEKLCQDSSNRDIVLPNKEIVLPNN